MSTIEYVKSSDVVNVVTQNVLLDTKRTDSRKMLDQTYRIHAVAQTLLNLQKSLDIVGIQEAHKKTQHNGEVLAELVGHGPGFWVNHNRKPYKGSPTGRAGEYMGLFGARVEFAMPIALGDQRYAVMTEVNGVAFATVHPRARLKARGKRFLQAQALTEVLDEYDNAVILGDFNEPPLRLISKGRGHLHRNGFRSVFGLTDQERPKTWPTGQYKELMYDGEEWMLRQMKHGWAFDDILVRGPRVNVLAAGVLERIAVDAEIVRQADGAVPNAASDHDGVWATLEIDPRVVP